MNDLIAGIVTVRCLSQRLASCEVAALELKLNEFLLAIRGSRSIEDASFHLDRMGEFQTELARAYYKWDVELSPLLRRLVQEFDRPDDVDLRLFVFKQIKAGDFLGGETT